MDRDGIDFYESAIQKSPRPSSDFRRPSLARPLATCIYTYIDTSNAPCTLSSAVYPDIESSLPATASDKDGRRPTGLLAGCWTNDVATKDGAKGAHRDLPLRFGPGSAVAPASSDAIHPSPMVLPLSRLTPRASRPVSHSSVNLLFLTLV